MIKCLQYIVLPACFFAFSIQPSRAQIAAWDFTGENTVVTSTADVFNTNLDGPIVLTRGAGAAASAGVNSFRTVGFQNNGISTANTDYFQFTLSSVTGYILSLSTIDARFAGTGTFVASPGVTSQFAYSLDGINFTLIGTPETSTSLTMGQINLASIAALQNLPSSANVTFRYYASGQTATGGWGFFSSAPGIYGLAIGGSFTASNADLSNLVLSSGSLSPSFSSGTTSYTSSVATSVSSITVTPTAADANTTITVNGSAVTSGSPSGVISLAVGSNTITTVGTAEDGITTKSYTIDITRVSSGTPVLTASALAGFGNVCINTTAGPNSFTLSGTDLNASDIELSAVAGFQYAEAPGGPYSNTLSFNAGSSFSNKSIYVQFSPALVQSYNGTILINGGGITDHTVPVTGSGINPAPAVTTVAAPFVSSSTATLSGTINTTVGCSSVTAYGFEYSNTNGFTNGSGTPVLSSDINGSGGFSFALQGLTANTTYYFKAFATNNGGTSYSSQVTFTTRAAPVVMAQQEDLTYRETFGSIATWSDGFTTGTGANHFSPVSVNTGSPIPNSTTITTSTASFISGTSGGVQKGSESIILLATGGTDNTASTAIDLSLDFTGVEAGTISFDWAVVFNSSGDRNGSLRVYASASGSSFTELTGAAVLNFTNNVAATGSIVNVALPVSFTNNPNARLRFYYYNGTGGITPTGSRPKISIDNLTITSTSTTPCVTPAAQPTALIFSAITEKSLQGSFTAASPTANKYLVIMSQNSSLTSDPVDGQVYEVGDNVGDGDVIAYSSATSFTASNLSGGTTYNFFIFSVNNACAGGPKYLVAEPLADDVTTVAGLPTCTAPADQPTNLSLSPATNTIQGSFTTGSSLEYLVLRSTAATLTVQPQNGQVYNTGNTLGNAVVVQKGNATNFTATGLSPATQYYFFIYSFQGQSCINGPAYNTTDPLAGSISTIPLSPCATPLAQPTSLSFNAGNTSVSGTFNASARADNYLIIRSTAATLSAVPADNTDYNNGDGLGDGTVVTNTSSTSFVAGNLAPATTYYFFVFSSNKNCTGGTKYLTAGALNGSVTTTSTPAYNVYFGNLHAHSDYSDGNQDHPGYTPADDYNYAMTAECMDFLGISEHNHFSSLNNPGNLITNYHQGSQQADAFTATHPNFIAMYGMEWGVISGGGHVVIYGDGMDDLFGWETNVGGLTGPNYDVFVPKNDYTGPSGLFKTVNDFVGKNTFATLAHPNNMDYNNLSNTPYNIVADNAIVGTAVANGPSTSTNTTYSNPGASMSYLWYYQKLLSKGYHLGPNIDHDNHNTTFGKTTRARTAVLAPSLSRTEIIKAMREMRFYATEDCDTKIDFTVNARVMGSVFTDRNAPSVSVRLSDATTETSSAKIRLMFGVPGSGIVAVPLDSAIGSSFDYVHNDLPVNTNGYYYTEITNGTAKMVTSPIWYTRTCSFATDTVAVVCNSFEWYGTTYTSSITTSRQFTTAGGCDSTATLHLTINYPVTGDTTAVACKSFSWYGNTYTTSGDYTFVLMSSGGCDSTVTMHLTINDNPVAIVTPSGPTSFCPGGSVVLNANAASSYEWSTGETTSSITVSATGIYSVTITNAAGCSSTSDEIIVSADDLIAPSVVTKNMTLQLNSSGTATISMAEINNGSSDNCSINADGYSLDKTSFDCTNIGANTVTLTVTDASGNSSTGAATVTVTDNEKPVVTCPVVPAQCYVSSGTYSIPALTAKDNCSISSVTYAITGSTTRNGSGTNASGNFNVGNSTITWTVTDGSGNTNTCTTTVVINPGLTVSVPDVYAVNPGGEANTIYKGYGPTSLTLNASVSGGTTPYAYKWTIGSSAGQGISIIPSLTVSPTNTTTYYLNVKDQYGCSAALLTKTIEVVDVRCGPKKDKITVCVMQKGVPATSCVAFNIVQGYLADGGYLGDCVVYTTATNMKQTPAVSELKTEALSVSVLPNPSTSSFRLNIIGKDGNLVTIRVMDALGTLVETRKVAGGKISLQVGANYRAGIYYVEAIQDGQRVTQKLVKL